MGSGQAGYGHARRGQDSLSRAATTVTAATPSPSLARWSPPLRGKAGEGPPAEPAPFRRLGTTNKMLVPSRDWGPAVHAVTAWVKWPGFGTLLIVFRTRETIWYGSPSEFGRRSSR